MAGRLCRFFRRAERCYLPGMAGKRAGRGRDEMLPRAALVVAAAATASCNGCGGPLADDDDASADVTAEAAFVGCPLSICDAGASD